MADPQQLLLNPAAVPQTPAPVGANPVVEMNGDEAMEAQAGIIDPFIADGEDRPRSSGRRDGSYTTIDDIYESAEQYDKDAFIAGQKRLLELKRQHAMAKEDPGKRQEIETEMQEELQFLVKLANIRTMLERFYAFLFGQFKQVIQAWLQA